MVCKNCNNSETYVKLHEHVYNIKDKAVKFERERRFCSKCDNLVYDKALDNEASLEALRIYNEQFGIDPQKIVELRNKYNLSQELFSKIIGCAKKTLVSYEQGKSIPNDIYMIILKTLLANPKSIELFIEANRERYAQKEYDKITENIAKYIGHNGKLLYNMTDSEPNIFNGFTMFSYEKIKNLILYLSKQSISKTKLLKEMFYSDFSFYANSCSSITGLEYVRLSYGPVPDDFEKILKEMSEANLIDYKYETRGNYECHSITAKKSVDLQIFSDEEKSVIEKVINYFKDFSSSEIKNFSHGEDAFEKTEANKRISYKHAFTLNELK